MIEWENYEKEFRRLAKENGKSITYINKWLAYSRRLYENGYPIIYTQEHLCNLVGYMPEYVYAVSNSSYRFYRCYDIPKKNGKVRHISEPLPSLKEIQTWLLRNLIENYSISPYAKAYVKGKSIKDNAKYHRNQKKLLSLDISDFYNSISSWYVYNVFISGGYSDSVSKMITQLCCFKNSLPQGAPTSAALSNIVMLDFDYTIGEYCKGHGIRYTRYADDMAFSGNFNECKIISLVKHELRKLNLKLNPKKTRLRIQGQQQEVTGIIVNNKLQLSREKRRAIRQEIYYIKKYGIKSHMNHLGEKHNNYLVHLAGKINFALFINPHDREMAEYRAYIKTLH